MTDPTYVRLRDLAEAQGDSPMQGRAGRWYKACEALDIDVYEGKRRGPHAPLLILAEDAERLTAYLTSPVEWVEAEADSEDDLEIVSVSEIGKHVVYVITLDPARPTRVKVGRTDQLTSRLRQIHYLCPDAVVSETYSVPPPCEGYALMLARSMSESRGAEVFDFESEDDLASFLSTLSVALSPIVEHFTS